MSLFQGISGILYKEFKGEIRSTYIISSIIIFSIVSVVISYMALGSLLSDARIISAVYWLILFFIAMTTLPRSFISDEEAGVSILLRLNSDSLAIYFGKLIYNIINNFLSALVTAVALLLISDSALADPLVFIINSVLVCICFAAGSTILSAIIAKSSQKSSLLPILGFPILIPIIYLGIDISAQAIAGAEANAFDLLFLLLYPLVLISLSVILFDFIWYE